MFSMRRDHGAGARSAAVHGGDARREERQEHVGATMRLGWPSRRRWGAKFLFRTGDGQTVADYSGRSSWNALISMCSEQAQVASHGRSRAPPGLLYSLLLMVWAVLCRGQAKEARSARRGTQRGSSSSPTISTNQILGFKRRSLANTFDVVPVGSSV